MWKALGESCIALPDCFAYYFAWQLQFLWAGKPVRLTLSYEFGKAIPTDNPKYIDYQEFKK